MDRIQPITMPKWGMTMTEGKIGAWLVSEGDVLEPGDEYVEVETEKITNVVEAALGGKIRRIVADEGQTIACGGLIGVLADDAVSEKELDEFLSNFETVEQEAEPAAHAQTRRMSVAGCTINVVSFASDEHQDETPLILVHGFGSDTRAWLFNFEALAQARPIYAIDLPSHGESAVDPAAMTFETLSGVVNETVRQLAPEGAHLAGHSLGGRLVLNVAAKGGAPVKSLVLLAPAGFSIELNTEFIDSFIAADRRRPMKAALRFLVRDTDLITSEMIEETLSYKRIDGVNEALRAAAEANFSKNQVSEGTASELASVGCPILVLWGEDDQILPSAGAQLARDEAEIMILPGVGHLLQMEASNKVNEAINHFLETAK